MKRNSTFRPRGFTLLETVIAIGVLAVLLSGFMVVFTPAAEGIRKSINVQEADRLASSLEQELTTLHKGEQTTDIATGFDKAFDWLRNSNNANQAILIYQYRAELGGSPRPDGTPEPVVSVTNKLPGKDFIVMPMARRKNDPLFLEDLRAAESAVYLVKCTQLVFDGGELKPAKAGEIKNPKGPEGGEAGPFTDPDQYPEAVIAFSAEFHQMPSKTVDYFKTGGPFATKFTKVKNPIFTRNLAVRR